MTDKTYEELLIEYSCFEDLEENEIESEGELNMTYQKNCIEAFKAYMKDQNLDETTLNIAVQSFISGFDYGSLNGASEDIQKYVVERLKSKKFDFKPEDFDPPKKPESSLQSRNILRYE
jgi:hypothetical protein